MFVMPELPEMETYRSLCTSALKGKAVTDIEIGREKSLNIPAEQFQHTVHHQTITGLDRRAKHLIFRLENGYSLLLHLMLGGWMFYGTEAEKPERTIQIKLSFGSQALYFIGLRLGYLHLMTEEQLNLTFQKLGPEPLSADFREPDWLRLIQSRSGALKTTLVDQSFLSGIGNCYADEICWHAGLMPSRKCRDLSESEQLKLFSSMREILHEAIHKGGYMDQPFTAGDRLTGGYNAHCKVYDEEGQPCRRCGQPIIKGEISSRKMFYCNGCQR
jgi:formamidopyrimidine-DNA glycosylase